MPGSKVFRTTAANLEGGEPLIERIVARGRGGGGVNQTKAITTRLAAWKPIDLCEEE